MPSFETRRIVPFSAEKMFAVVADVERYPEFLPLCTGLKILKRSAGEGGGETLDARMSIGFKTIAESFTTRVDVQPEAKQILVRYLDGPFKRLDNRWRFTDMGAGTSEIYFFIDYEFRSLMLGALMGAMFDQAFRKFSEAFEARARSIYGAPAGA